MFFCYQQFLLINICGELKTVLKTTKVMRIGTARGFGIKNTLFNLKQIETNKGTD